MKMANGVSDQDVGKEQGGMQGKGTQGSVESRGEKGDSSEFVFDEWPETASFSKAVECAVEEVLEKPSSKGKKREVRTTKESGIGGSKENGGGGEKGQKRGREDDSSEGKQCKPVNLTYADLMFMIEEISEVWPTRSQKKEALEKLVKKRKEKK